MKNEIEVNGLTVQLKKHDKRTSIHDLCQRSRFIERCLIWNHGTTVSKQKSKCGREYP